MKTQTASSSTMSIQKIALTALFAALTCVATMVIRIPVPATGGYLNLGDGFVILCGILLGPAYGFLAAGIGSGLADLLAGYTQYVPGTFLIKGLAALLVAIVFQALVKTIASSENKNKNTVLAYVAIVIASIALAVVVSGGYFLYESTLLGYGWGAAASIVPNLFQNLAGLIVAALLYPVVPLIKKTAKI